MGIDAGQVESGSPARACWGLTVSEYLLAWGIHPGCGMDGWNGFSGGKSVARRPTKGRSFGSVNGRLLRKAYGGGTSLGVGSWEVSTWGGGETDDIFGGHGGGLG